MKHSRWQVLSVLAVIVFAVILATALYRTNIHSPRISVTELAELDEVPENGPFLLEGGQITANTNG